MSAITVNARYEVGPGRYAFHKSCMKPTVSSFELVYVEKGSAYVPGPQVQLNLCNLDLIKYVDKDGSEIHASLNGIEDLTLLCARNILEYLYKTECVKKGIFTYRARWGAYNSDKITILDPITFSLNNIQSQEKPIEVYAYLTDRKICILFNESDPEFFQKVDDVLSLYLPQKKG
jgi:hypothetical protein